MVSIARQFAWATLVAGATFLYSFCCQAQTSASDLHVLNTPGASPTGRAVDRRPGRKNVLAWIDSRSATQSHAAAVIERLGHESGLYDTFIRADARAALSAPQAAEDFGLGKFDAIFFMGSQDDDLSGAQRAALLKFVADGGGFVGGHAACDAFPAWEQFGEMIGGRLDQHPWGKTDTTLVVENPSFPGMERIPRVLATHDETYEIRNLSRSEVDVLVRLDPTKLDASKPHRKDGDFPMVWVKTYGKGRVYNNTLGHELDAWDNAAYQRMYLAAMKWTLGITATPLPQPHGLVTVKGTARPLK